MPHDPDPADWLMWRRTYTDVEGRGFDPERWRIDELGLRLDKQKMRAEIVVIDHIESPSEN